MKTIALMAFVAMFLPLAFGQAKVPKKITAAEAKDHVGETVMVCGMAVDTKIPLYAIGNKGKPVAVDIDQPEPTPVFYFATFPTDPHKPLEVAATYKGKRVCVTGEIQAGKVPFILVLDPNQTKIQADDKK